MKLFSEERLAVFVVLAVLIPASLLLGYARYPQIFLSPSLQGSQETRVVTVAGAVERPGAYRISKGSVARDAALLAGPETEAALEYLDFPIPLVENELVYVPRAGEEIEARERNREKALRRLRMPVQVRRIDINTAPQDELATIPGIGDKTAAAVVLERMRKPFRSTADIERVQGIGPKKYEKMKEYITVEQPTGRSQIPNPRS
jgi:competence protein ComEA